MSASMTEALTHMVEWIRLSLSEEYDITHGKYKDYAWLCDESVGRLSVMATEWKVEFIHGEQKHLPRIKRNAWWYQHTWARVTNPVSGEVVYVDPTCQQFRFIYPTIPDYYVSHTPPKWYYPDSQNPRFNKHLKKLKIFHGPNCEPVGLLKFYDRIIDEKIWGSISNFIHRILYAKKN